MRTLFFGLVLLCTPAEAKDVKDVEDVEDVEDFQSGLVDLQVTHAAFHASRLTPCALPPRTPKRLNAPTPKRFPDSLPPTPLLFGSIDTFHARQARIRLLELAESRRGNWLRYLPAIGIAYTPTGAPRPAVSYSSTLLYTAQKDRQQRDAKRLAILQQAALDAEADKRTLLQLLQRHAALQRELDAQRAVHALDTELYRFYEKQAATQELLPAEFLLRKREYLLKCLELEQQEARLRGVEAEIRGVARWDG